MGSAEIARTTDEMKIEMDVVLDAENGDVIDAKTTDEMTKEKDAEILETKTRVPHTNGGVPSSHPVSLRVCVTRMKSGGSLPARTRKGQTSDRPVTPGRSPKIGSKETRDSPTAEIASTAVRTTTWQLNAQTKARPSGTARPSRKQSRRVPPRPLLPASLEHAEVAELCNRG